MKKKYYKLTTKWCGKPYSYSAYYGGARVQYRVGKWVKAPDWLAEKGYHLFVFDTLENATREASGHNPSFVNIWECEIRGLFRTLPPFLSSVCLDHYNNGLSIGFEYVKWENIDGGNGKIVTEIKLWEVSIEPAPHARFPEGTVMAREVKLIKKIWG